MAQITLTDGQQAGLDTFTSFILDPNDDVLVIEGYSGTGKSTLVETLLQRLPNILATGKLINPDGFFDWAVLLTATTNKAAEVFSHITGDTARTIHSHLGLRVSTDYVKGTSELIPNRQDDIHTKELIFIDEASYIDAELLDWIFKLTRHCKIVFIGDPAQLLNVRCTRSPVFDASFSKIKLTEVVRQAKGNPIVDLSTKLRETVNTGEFFQFTPDGTAIRHVDRKTFGDLVQAEFARSDWEHDTSKILAWTNKRVIAYNHAVRDMVKGGADFKVGDYAVCNKQVGTKRGSIRTDQTVLITHISNPLTKLGVNGRMYEVNGRDSFFMPDALEHKAVRLTEAKAQGDYTAAKEITDSWIDLRAQFACTINKSQGSTYDTVFIDLDDIKRCTSGNQIARMLYVGVSRARKSAVLCGDLV